MRLLSVRIKLVPILRLTGVVGISLFLGWLVVRGVSWSEVADLVYEFPPGRLIVAFLVFTLSILMRAWRFHVLFVSERVSFTRIFLVQNAGIGLNNISPIRLLSEPVQLMLLTRRSGITGGMALATLVVEHLMDITVTAILLILGIVLMPELRGFTIQLIVAAILGFVGLLLFLAIVRGMESFPIVNKVPMIGTAISSVRTLRHSPFRLFLSLLGTFGHWITLGLCGWVIASGFGIDVGIAVVVVLFLGSLFFVSAIPSLPGGAITFEAAVVYSLSLFGVHSEPALAFALLVHIIIFTPSTIIALLVLPREGIKLFKRTELSE